MKLSLRISPAAQDEAEQAGEYYSAESPGLDLKLAEALNNSFARIVETPLAFPIVFGSEVRRAYVKRFPFSIFFAVREDHIWVYSIFHHSRNPIIWRRRTD